MDGCIWLYSTILVSNNALITYCSKFNTWLKRITFDMINEPMPYLVVGLIGIPAMMTHNNTKCKCNKMIHFKLIQPHHNEWGLTALLFQKIHSAQDMKQAPKVQKIQKTQN